MAERVVNSAPIHVLVVGDDAFQRLALIDILSLCNYQVTPCENGRIALEELTKEGTEQRFDLVLLDVMMPEMDGLELLDVMQKNDQLKEMPVIMMSSNEEMTLVSKCLANGAKDYLIKPIRVQVVRSLSQYADGKSTHHGSGQANSLDQYERLKTIGRGASGAVQLVRRTSDGKLFALKQICMEYLADSEKKLAQNEVMLLKVLVGPTIIRYYDSFMEGETINIVMEYAEGGNLSEKIKQAKMEGRHFDDDTILSWFSQIVLGVMLMHSKNILHRDIKTQNIFLTKDNYVKLGDFGIAKSLSENTLFAKTACGTPYFMSPEVCRGQQYNQKSDVWALGCTLYEMVMLKRPFDHETLSGVFERICDGAFDPLPEGISDDIRLLLTATLHKDPLRRPSVWEIARLPSVKERIQRFVEETGVAAEVMPVLHLEPKIEPPSALTQDAPALTEQQTEAGSTQPEPASVESPKLPQLPPLADGEDADQLNDRLAFDMASLSDAAGLEALAKVARTEVEITDRRSGWFSKHVKSFRGCDLANWITNKLGVDREKAVSMAADMLDQQLIHHVEDKEDFRDSSTSLYRFQEDKPDIALNMTRIWSDQVRKASLVGAELVHVLNSLLPKCLSLDDLGNPQLDLDAVHRQPDYQRFVTATGELQRVEIITLSRHEKMAFFLNVYQAMLLHQLVEARHHQSTTKSWLSWSNWFAQGYKYNIAGHDFTLRDLKHGVLRGNRKPFKSFRKPFGNNDPRKHMAITTRDPRVHVALPDPPSVPAALVEYHARELDDTLDQVAQRFCHSCIYVNVEDMEIVVPTLFEAYREDFGNSDSEVLSWVLQYIDLPVAMDGTVYTKEDLVKLLAEGNLLLRYDG
eukprot:GILK01012068.1.p1 GENE.GILK01012068.1~~GILK01012068.1.p1  ORF type:complete len:862 (+),score=168.21 GILK01012068.1:96-2681(+)